MAQKKARRQIDSANPSQVALLNESVGDGSVYNIWYGKWSSEDKRPDTSNTANTRCIPEYDSGLTVGSFSKDPIFCIHFAKGSCIQGPDCNFLHRIPSVEDEGRVCRTKDIFGRDRFSTDREDMTGIGNFNKDSKTLFVGRVGSYDNMDEVIRKHFSSFGIIEKIKVVPQKNIAYVRYSSRLNAEFAKVAMRDQSLDNKEILNIRWATDEQEKETKVEKHLSQAEIIKRLMKNEKVESTLIEEKPEEESIKKQSNSSKKIKLVEEYESDE